VGCLLFSESSIVKTSEYWISICTSE